MQLRDQRRLAVTDRASTLLIKILARFGSGVSLLALGNDLIHSGGVVTSWPTRVGGSLTNSTANRFGISSLGVSVSTSPNGYGQAKSLAVTCSYKSVLVVTKGFSGASDNYAALAFSSASGATLIHRNLQTQVLFATGTHYIDGAASDAIPESGNHVLQCDHGTTQTNLHIGGEPVNSRVWPAPIAAILALTSAPSAGDRSAAVSDLLAYVT